MAEGEGKAGSPSAIYVTAKFDGMPVEYAVTPDKGVVLRDGRKLTDVFPEVDISDVAKLCSRFYDAVAKAEQAKFGVSIARLSTEKEELLTAMTDLEKRLEQFTTPMPDAEPKEQKAQAGGAYTVNVMYEGGQFPLRIVTAPDQTLAGILETYKDVQKAHLPKGIDYLKIVLAGERNSLGSPPGTPIERMAKVGMSLDVEVYIPDLEERASDIFKQPVTLASTSGRAQKVLDIKGTVIGAELVGQFYVRSGEGSEVFYENVATKGIAQSTWEKEIILAFEVVEPTLPPQAKDKGTGQKTSGKQDEDLTGRLQGDSQDEQLKSSFDPKTGIAIYVLPNGTDFVKYKPGFFGGIKVIGSTHIPLGPHKKALRDFYVEEQAKAKRTSPPQPSPPPMVPPPSPPPLDSSRLKFGEEVTPPPPLPPPPADDADESEGSGAGKDDEEEYECPSCGAGVNADDIKCDKCGAEFADEDLETAPHPPPPAKSSEEVFECPSCGARVGKDDTKCGKCGAEFDE